jgi:single-stranded DNA-binding protein
MKARVDVNEITIQGSLNRDPDPLRTTHKDDPVCSARITNRRPKVGFVGITAFGENAEVLAGLEEGQMVEVSGALDWREWRTKKGDKRQEVSVIADELLVIDQEESEVAAVNATQGAIKLAKEESIDINEVKGSGLNGRITKKDVEEHIS